MIAKQVSAGIIIKDNKLLIAQRKHGKSCEYLWEFPGGKQEKNETLAECLQRELFEEFNISVSVGDFLTKSRYEYDFGVIELNAFFVNCKADCIDFHPDHEQIKWIAISDIDNYQFAPADIPIVKELKAYWNSAKK